MSVHLRTPGTTGRTRMAAGGLAALACCAALSCFASPAAAAEGMASPLPEPGAPDSHEAFLAHLADAQDLVFGELLARYDTYLAEFPRDVRTAVERCRFLERAACEEEGACPYWDQAEACREELSRTFPDSPLVQLYQLEQSWGDEGLALANELLEDEGRGWDEAARARVHQQLAWIHNARNESELALQHAREAMALDAGADLSLMAAPLLEQRGEVEEAIRVLRSHRDPDAPYWEEIQRVRLFVELGAFDDAAALLGALAPPEGSEPDHLLRAEIWLGMGKVGRAREELSAAVDGPGWQWQAAEILERRFQLELEHGDAASSLAAYERLRDEGYWIDPFLKKRIQLGARHPGAPWRLRDAQGLAAAMAVVVVLMLLPGLVLLPAHYVGLLRTRRHPDRVPTRTRWGLRHCWYALALILLVEVPFLYLDGVEELDDLADAFRDTLPVEALAPIPDRSLAIGALVALALLTIGVVPLLRAAKPLLGWGVWTRAGTIGLALASVVLLRMGLGVWLVLVGDGANEALAPTATVTEQTFRAVGSLYGLPVLFTALVVVTPWCEELIFRGVVFEGLKRYLSGGWANLGQASLFAAAHEGWMLFPFYLAFGAVAGRLAQRSQSLLGPMILHAANNGIAFIALARSIG